MDIQAASLDQIVKARSGRSYRVSADVGGIAQRIQAIDPSLVLRYHEESDHYSVVQVDPVTGVEHLVTTALPVNGGLDPRLVERVEKITRPDYDVVSKIAEENDRIDRENERRLTEQIAERAERVYHKLRKAQGIQNRIYVP